MHTRTVIGTALACAWALGAAAQPAPGTPAPPCRPADTQVVCGHQSPEDLVTLPGGQWVVASAYSGSGGVYLVRVSDRTSTVVYPAAGAKESLDRKTYDTCPGPPNAATKAKFQTHGLYLQERPNRVHRLFVVLHGGRESVEVFDVDARQATPAFTWIGCAVAPDPIGLNSVRGLPDGGFVATNFLPRGGAPTAMAQMQTGQKNGELWEWHPGTAWRMVPGSEASGANGLEISPDDKWFYVAAWGSQSFFRLSRGEATPKRDEVNLGFRVDNIRWASDGSILATGQQGAPNAASETVIVKINPETLRVREVLRRASSTEFGFGTVAVEVGRQWWVGSFRSDRIAIFPATP